MIREPYGLNPYNTTIDTSVTNNYHFIFSGDELESFKIDLMENNTEEPIIYSSDNIHRPGTFNNTLVDDIILPVPLISGNDGSIMREYKITWWRGDLNLPFTAKTFTINNYSISDFTRQNGVLDGVPVIYLTFQTRYLIQSFERTTRKNITFFDSSGNDIGNITDISLDRTNTLFSLSYNPATYGDILSYNFQDYVLNVENIDYYIKADGKSAITNGLMTLDLDLVLAGDNYIGKSSGISYTLLHISNSTPQYSEAGEITGYNTTYIPEVQNYLQTLGKDLIWRIKMWENNAIYSQQFYFDQIPISTDINTYLLDYLVINPGSTGTNYLLNLISIFASTSDDGILDQNSISWKGLSLGNKSYIINISFKGETRRILDIGTKEDNTYLKIDRPFFCTPAI